MLFRGFVQRITNAPRMVPVVGMPRRLENSRLPSHQVMQSDENLRVKTAKNSNPVLMQSFAFVLAQPGTMYSRRTQK